MRLPFLLSINKKDLPNNELKSHKVLEINNRKFDLSKSFTNLNLESYKKIVNNHGFKISTYSEAFELVNMI